MKRCLLLAVMVFGMRLTIACSGDSFSGGSDNSIQKCDAMLDAVCGYYSRCEEVAQTQTYNSAYNQCLSSLQEQNKSCSNAIDTKDTYDTCLSQVKAGTCPFKLPSDCQRVISVNDSGGSGGTSSGNGGTNSSGNGGTSSSGSGGSSSGNAGTSSGGGGTSASNDVLKKCQEFSSEYCSYARSCASPSQQISQEKCLEILPSKGVDCTTIKSVTSKFDDCIADLKVATCPEKLPSDCQDMLLK